MRVAILLFWSLTALPMLYGQSDWPAYGGDLGNTRYSALDQINIQNITKLTQAWAFDMRTPVGAKANRPAQATPLVVNDVMYMVTAYQSVVALQPETGKVIWVFTHKHAGRPPRGIGYWPGDNTNPPEILFGTWDGFLLAVDAKTGKAVPGFGKQGEIDLKVAMKDKFPDVHYGLSGAPVIYKNLAITGSHTQDSPGLGARGDARAWDVRTGKLVWTFHSVPQPGEKGHETWLNDGWQDRSGVNAWTTSTIDAQTGTLYMTFDSPSYDLYGGDRPGNDLFGNALVALDAATGKLKWYFQTIHHDIWDYDAPATPTLVDVVRGGKPFPAVIQTGKTGLVFILDRRNGKPIYPVEERPVPKGDVPGEWYSPTQPFPVKPPPLARNTWKPGELTAFTPEQKKYCEDLFKNAQNDGPFAPIRMTETVQFPGSDGGFNWGGGSFALKLGYYFL